MNQRSQPSRIQSNLSLTLVPWFQHFSVLSTIFKRVCRLTMLKNPRRALHSQTIDCCAWFLFPCSWQTQTTQKNLLRCCLAVALLFTIIADNTKQTTQVKGPSHQFASTKNNRRSPQRLTRSSGLTTCTSSFRCLKSSTTYCNSRTTRTKGRGPAGVLQSPSVSLQKIDGVGLIWRAAPATTEAKWKT